MSKKKREKTGANGSVNEILKGVLDVTRSGIGYVVIPNGAGDVLVRPGNFGTALNGDTVRVKIIKDSAGSKRREGKLTEVVSRKQTEFIGHIQLSTNFAFFVPDTDKPMPDLFIPLDKLKGAKHKERVIARLVQWEKGDKKPLGEVMSILSKDDENDAAMKELLAQAGFPLSFPSAVLDAANALPVVIDKAEIKKRKDFRKTLTFTIDPLDAKDFDDAISIKKIKGNQYEIGVHIADAVSYTHLTLPTNREV